MSTYTTELRYYCESIIGLDKSTQYPSVNSVVTQAAPLIFENFPIYDEEYRLRLETKILKHYYTREICAETPGLWKLWLNNRMNEIMPYYNLLYESAMIKFDPLRDYDLHRERQGENTVNKSMNQTGENNGTNNTKATSDQTQNSTSDTDSSTDAEATLNSDKHQVYKFSNTPQGSIDNEPIFSSYLTEASDTDETLDNSEKSNTTSNSSTTSKLTNTTTDTINNDTSQNSTINQTSDENAKDWYTEHVYGKMGQSSYSKLIEEYRQTLINIDQMIIDELADLFMLIY